MKRKFTLNLVSLLTVLSVCSLASCKKEEEKIEVVKKEINPEIRNTGITGPDKEIKISYTMAGFGDAWIKSAVQQFNQIFEGYGYKAVLGRSDANFTSEPVKTEIMHPADNDYDLYFTISESILETLVNSSYSILKDKNKVLLADLSDVLDTKAFDMAGYDEEGTIRSHMNEGSIMFSQYITDPESKWYGKTYSMQFIKSVAGIAVNMDVLKQFGYTEIPRTTNELYAMFDSVNANRQKSTITGNDIYPVTWPGANATGYYAYVLGTLLGQWKGYQGYNDFYALKPATGDTITNGYDVYDDIGIKYSWSVIEKICDQNNACNGTVTTVDHLMSEQMLADGEAMFAVTGDWCYNELIGCDYKDDELNCIEMLQMPVMSEIADLVGLPGDAVSKDALLSKIIKGLDEDKSFATIVSENNGVTLAQVERIAEARGIYYDMGTTHQCLVPSYSDNIDGAKLFLRFIYSLDVGDNIYAKYAHGVNNNTNSNPTYNNYLKSIARITSKSYSKSVGAADKLSLIRMNGGIGFCFEPYAHWINIVKGMALGTEDYDSQTVYDSVKESMRKNWSVILSTAGVGEEE